MSRLRVTEKTRESKKKEGERERGRTKELRKSGSWRLERVEKVHSVKVALSNCAWADRANSHSNNSSTDGIKYEQVVFDLETTSRGTLRSDSTENEDFFVKRVLFAFNVSLHKMLQRLIIQSVGFLNDNCSTTPIFRTLLLRCWLSFKVLFVNSTDGRLQFMLYENLHKWV